VIRHALLALALLCVWRESLYAGEGAVIDTMDALRNNCGGLQFICDDDCAVRYDFTFPIKNTAWTKITVVRRDLIPVLPGPKSQPLDPAKGNRPAKLFVGDGTHLSPVGHDIMAQTVLAAIEASDADSPKKAAGDGKEKAGWKALFDGKSLAGWKEANFGGEGEVHVEKGAIVLEQGNDMTGVTYAGKDFPRMNYEVTLEGKKIKGRDFFCTTTFPVGKEYCSLVVGGWGGSVVGLSSINGADASENETRNLQKFEVERWYRVRIRVTESKVQAWIDDKQVVDLETQGKRLSIRAECGLCRPFGIATWRTLGAVRDIRLRSLTDAETKAGR
jgi:hypothetical protein